MLAVALGMSGFAQRANVSKEIQNQSVTAKKPSALRISDGSQAQAMHFNTTPNMVSTRNAEDFEEFITMTTNYDLQSNSALGNRIAVWPDGSASFVATWDHSGETTYPDRGAGYNFFDGEDMGDEPEVRQEPMKSGWPSIVACGDGEILASHATGVNLYYRPTKGEGEWTLIHNWGATYGSPTWPRVVVSGPNNEYVHVVMCKQISLGSDEYDNHIYYARIVRDGDNWIVPDELIDFPGVDNTAEGDYRNQLSADDYVMAANGNNVAVMFSAYTTEVFYMISHDNGETWERQVVAPYPYYNEETGEHVHAVDFDDWPEEDVGMIDTISTSDNSHSIAIDNNGVVHVAFGLFHWRVTGGGYYTYYPAGYYGIVYWNSNYTNEQGGHEIPLFGDFSGDVNHPEWEANHLGWSLNPDRIYELGEADDHQTLNVFGYVDEDGDGEISYDNVLNATWHYRSLGLCTMPGISVDNYGNVAIIFSVWSETRVNDDTGFSFRSVYVSLKDSAGHWFVDEDGINLSEAFIHSMEEAYPATASPIAYDGSFWVMYSGDENQGLYLDISETYPNSNLGELTENYIYAVKVTPVFDGWDGVVDHSADNPMTAARVYPNPTTGTLYVEVNASQSSEVNMTVFNIMGQKVAEKSANVSTGINTTSIDTNEFSSGIYFVTVKANGFEKTMKFVVK